MQKSSSQKALKVISIIMIVFAALAIVGGLVVTAGGGLLGVEGVNTADDDVTLTGGLAMVLGLMFLVGGIVDLIIGIFGLRGANNPKKIGVFFVLAIIGVVFAAISALMTLMGGTIDASTIISELISLALPIVCVILANNIKKENGM